MTNKVLSKLVAWIVVYLIFSLTYAFAEETNSILRFEITQFDIQGNTLLPQQEILQLLQPYAGQDRNFDTVQQALESLENAYQQHGYAIVRVVLPEQELNQGVVILKVVEPKVGAISVTGNQFFDTENIKRSMPTLQEGQVPIMAKISANLKVANDDPAKKTTLQFQSGKEDGYVDALLKVEDQKIWSTAISVDNTGDETTGRNRLTVMFQNANICGLDHVLSMQYTTSFTNPNDVNVLGIGYHIPLYSLSDSVDFYANYSNVNSGTVTAGVFDLAVNGSGSIFGARYNHNILKTGNYESTLSGGVDYKRFNNNITFSGLPLGSNINILPISLSYTGNWAVTGATTNFYMTVVRNIPSGADSSSADFAETRSGATQDYSLMRYGVSALYALPSDWQIRFALNGQQSSDALVSGEQFGAGGANSVRGFTERDIAEDKGRTTNLELYTGNLCEAGAQCRLLFFYDTGFVARNHALPGEINQESIGSVGLGFRSAIAPRLLLQADAGHVIDASVTGNKGSNMTHFKLTYTF